MRAPFCAGADTAGADTAGSSLNKGLARALQHGLQCGPQRPTQISCTHPISSLAGCSQPESRTHTSPSPGALHMHLFICGWLSDSPGAVLPQVLQLSLVILSDSLLLARARLHSATTGPF